VILPDEDYLKSVREIADKFDVLLIFDEVLTGFRLALEEPRILRGKTRFVLLCKGDRRRGADSLRSQGEEM